MNKTPQFKDPFFAAVKSFDAKIAFSDNYVLNAKKSIVILV